MGSRGGACSSRWAAGGGGREAGAACEAEGEVAPPVAGGIDIHAEFINNVFVLFSQLCSGGTCSAVLCSPAPGRSWLQPMPALLRPSQADPLPLAPQNPTRLKPMALLLDTQFIHSHNSNPEVLREMIQTRRPLCCRGHFPALLHRPPAHHCSDHRPVRFGEPQGFIHLEVLSAIFRGGWRL